MAFDLGLDRRQTSVALSWDRRRLRRTCLASKRIGWKARQKVRINWRTTSKQKKAREQEQGKTIDLANQKSTDISVKLTAKPEKKSSDQPVPVNPINCGHSLECDCQNFKKPPKLPHKLPHLQPANPHAAAPQLAKENYPAVDNHSLTPLNKKNV